MFDQKNTKRGRPKTAQKPQSYTAKQPRTHTYTKLSHTSLGNTELYNLYGVVIDASCPHPKKAFHRQLLKIIDPTMHYKPSLPLSAAEQ
jgi:hypothetical protein